MNTNLKYLLTLSAILASCAHQAPKQESDTTRTESVQYKLQSTDGGFLLGLEGKINVYQDGAADGGAPCSTLGGLVATEDTDADDVDLPFSLVNGDYCFELAAGWTLYYNTSTDGGVSWTPIPSGDVDHITDPHPIPVSVSMGSVDVVTFSFDWVPPAFTGDYGNTVQDFIVFTNACSGVCGTDAGAAQQCAELNGSPAACYYTCMNNADCEMDGGPSMNCLRGNLPMSSPGLCVAP